jgi:uncharacterized membrane protein
MWHLTKVYFIIIPVFLLLDYLWLGRIMARFYREQLGSLARGSGDSMTPDIPSAVVVYLLIPLGIVLFALPHVSDENLIGSSLLWGFLYGIVLYGVYDLTNYSVLAKWPLKLTVVDILWGGVLNAVMTLVAAYVDNWLR